MGAGGGRLPGEGSGVSPEPFLRGGLPAGVLWPQTAGTPRLRSGNPRYLLFPSFRAPKLRGEESAFRERKSRALDPPPPFLGKGRAPLGMTESRLLGEEAGLAAGLGGGAAARAMLAAVGVDSEDFHAGQGSARHKGLLVAAVQIGRGGEGAVGGGLEEVVDDHAFEHFLVAETQAHPEAFELGSAQEGAAVGPGRLFFPVAD